MLPLPVTVGRCRRFTGCHQCHTATVHCAAHSLSAAQCAARHGAPLRASGSSAAPVVPTIKKCQLLNNQWYCLTLVAVFMGAKRRTQLERMGSVPRQLHRQLRMLREA